MVERESKIDQFIEITGLTQNEAERLLEVGNLYSLLFNFCPRFPSIPFYLSWQHFLDLLFNKINIMDKHEWIFCRQRIGSLKRQYSFSSVRMVLGHITCNLLFYLYTFMIFPFVLYAVYLYMFPG